MARPAAMGFTYHALDFSLPAPTGYAICGRCNNFITTLGCYDATCPASFGRAPAIVPPRPVLPGGLRCALCGEPMQVDPRHREHVQFFGTICNACAEAAGAAA